MNFIKPLFISFLAFFLFIGCGKNESLTQSETTVKTFFKSIKDEKKDLMIKYYPKVSKLTSYYKSDSVKVKSSDFINDSTIVVSVENFFTNGFGKISVHDIDLYVLKTVLFQYI